MKLIRKLLSEVEDKNEVASDYLNLATGDDGESELEAIIDLWETINDSMLDAEVVTDEDGTLYDYRIFDPQHKLGGGIYTNFSGWTDWRNQYQDNEGNDIDTIFDEYGGVPQGI